MMSQRFNSRAHRQRSAAERRAMVSGPEDADRRTRRHARADRHARAEPFRQRHHIGLDARPLVRKPFAGASDAALHLVDHQQPAALVTQLPQRFDVVEVGHVDTAFALQHLKPDGKHAAIGIARRA